MPLTKEDIKVIIDLIKNHKDSDDSANMVDNMLYPNPGDIDAEFERFMEKTKEQRKKAVSTRYEYNKKIIETLAAEIEEHRDLRFFQLLYHLDMISGNTDNLFFEEPCDTYKKMKK